MTLQTSACLFPSLLVCTQATERQHVSSRSREPASSGGRATTAGSGSSSSSGDRSGSEGGGSSDLELDADAPDLQADSQATPGTGMNRSMMSLYGAGPRTEAGSAAGGAAGAAAMIPGEAQAAEGQQPAFAPVHVIAAAAARAAKEVAQQKAAAAGGGDSKQAGASGSMEVCSQGAAAAQQAAPASPSAKQQQEQEQEAAPSTSGRPAPGTVAKNKRGGATPADRCRHAASAVCHSLRAVPQLPGGWQQRLQAALVPLRVL